MISAKRDRLIEVAADLFYRNGIHATGVDRILAEASVAKMTLYKHFKSKEDLIIAAFERSEKEWREWFVSAVEGRAIEPKAKLLAIFDALEEYFDRDGWNGCPFIKASSEFPDLENPVHRVAAHHQKMTRAYLTDIAAEAGAPDPGALAAQLHVLLEGAIATAQLTGDTSVVKDARAAGALLVERALPTLPG